MNRAIFLLLWVVSRVNYASSLEYRFLPSITFNTTAVTYARYQLKRFVNYTTQGERTFCIITQPLTGTGIVFLKLVNLSLGKKELRLRQAYCKRKNRWSTKRIDIPADKNKWGGKRGQGSCNIWLLAFWAPGLCCFCYLPIVLSPTRFVPETIMLYSQPC